MRKKKLSTRQPAGRKAPRQPVTTPPTAESPKGITFPIVGIGASAGGLDAFRKFFQAMPPRTGMAFVLIQHLDPTHESLTAELLAKHTSMKVEQVSTEMGVEPNHVYVNPPNKDVTIVGGWLRLRALGERHARRMPIDLFLRSLAEEQHERAIGIILSGTGTDGSIGIKEIKGAGGMVMVQEAHTAQYDGMPRSSIGTGAVDFVLPVERMPDVLVKYVTHPYVLAKQLSVSAESGDNSINRIVTLIRTRINFDFTGYKKATLTRRIQRRMGLRHIENIGEYLQHLRDDADEVRALFRDLLIGVTSFFREPDAWHALERQVLPQLIRRKGPRAPLRVWVPGCATGEEAYGLAMVLIEQVREAHKNCEIQIFASDVDTEALDFARTGLYPESIAADVSQKRLRRFFIREDLSYRVNKELRDAVIFAEQNLIADPPFSKLDLISCRNLLIYLEPEVQRNIVALLHFALSEGGCLFLGSAETTGAAEDLFETVSKKWRIYRRIGPTRHDRVLIPIVPQGSTSPSPSAGESQVRVNRLAHTVQQLFLDRYAPAGVVINRKYEILYFSGRTQDYIVQPTGPPTQDLFEQAREGWQTKLRAAVHKAIREDQPVTFRGVRVRLNKQYRNVTVTVEPLKVSKDTEGLLLVTFTEERQVVPQPASRQSSKEESIVRELEHEIKITREDLQSTIEELETANEELKASNEEVMSVNEELQSTNEELETSKEELQSLNEELSTVNAQLQSKVEELGRLNNDLDNLLTSTNIPTVFLDRQYRIRRFTPAATRLFNLIPSDIGRPVGDIVQKFTDPELLEHAGTVLTKLTAVSKEVQSQEGRWYIRQILPYRTQDDRIDGVVLTFSDVAAEALQEARLNAETIINTLSESLLVLDSDLRIQSANRQFYEWSGLSPAETAQRVLYKMNDRCWDIADLRARLTEVLREKKPLNDLEIEHTAAQLGQRTLVLNARVLTRGGGRPDQLLLAIRDVTERKRMAEQLRGSEEKTRSIWDAVADSIITIDAHGTILSVNPAATRTFGYGELEIVGQNVKALMPPPYRDAHDSYVDNYVRTGVARIIGARREVVAQRRDGTVFPADLVVSEFHDGKESKFVGILRDVTQRKHAEEQLRHDMLELAHVLRISTAGELAGNVAHAINQPLSVIANDLEACTALVRKSKHPSREILDLLEAAIADAVRAGEIVHRLRDFIQKREPVFERSDLCELTRRVLHLMEPDLNRHHVMLQLGMAAPPLVVHADRVLIEQVILNLLRNAIEAMEGTPAAERELLVQVRSTDGQAEVVVRDAGSGLSRDVEKRLFEPFFSTKPQGLGMGLAISRSIVEVHHGHLSLQPSGDGRRGTSARFVLPLLRES